MTKSNQTRLYWQKILGIFAILSAVNTVSAEAIANPHNSTELYLAQVGVRSRINSPTPVNLRPRHHIFLPKRSRSSRYHRKYHRYNRHRDRHYSDYNNNYRNRRSNRKDYCHHYSNYDCDAHGHRHRDDYYNRSRKRKSKGSITIYF